ncbi:WW domain-containing oxidoreductase isoform X1 [Ischnura elegans]|uniref:WW domain-containing oxidoreductase isoform X1 n=1 Tax=Ischnura elegans TaxID=197161 RepID=UPI001ED8B548|nr:WW domain-containing oxidoreductase isoform X1 [Ischnura elegans]
MAAIIPDSDSEDELPPCWEERATTDGSVYYVNHSTKGTQWHHPRTGKKKVVSGDLPPGWERAVGDDGRVLFVDHVNRRTTYSDPRLAFASEEKEHPGDFRQRFDASTSALQILHGRLLAGKVAVVTGANCGIGFETVRSLALHGCTVVMACRRVAEGEKAADAIREEAKGVGNVNGSHVVQADVEVMELDLSKLHSVKAFATNFKLKHRTLDILILNAAVFGLGFSLTEDSYETHFQVNHLGPFYLTLLLEEPLMLASPSRVVVVSSESHRFSYITCENISCERLSPSVPSQYSSGMSAYNDSKLCNVLFAAELFRRWGPGKRGVFANSLHPGNMVSSNLSRSWWLYRLLFALVRPFTKSLQQAASTSIYCAVSPDLDGVGGLYFNNCCCCPPSAAAQDNDLASRLWDLSVEMVEKVMGKGACGLAAT